MEIISPLVILSFVLSAKVNAASITTNSGISYEELTKLNFTCNPEDICANREPDHSPNYTNPNTCSCHAECSSLGTCCIDSPYRGKNSKNQKCVTVEFPEAYLEPSGYYMVQSCPEKADWKHDCEGSLQEDGDGRSDLLRIAPVTSLNTNTTYKNYFCFRCYELTDNFLYWDLKILGDYDIPWNDDFELIYNPFDDIWFAISNDKDFSVIVDLQFVIPLKIKFPVISCNTKIITDCPDSWKDDAIRSTCHSYMAVLYSSFDSVYQNAHCLLCNSLVLEDISCTPHLPKDDEPNEKGDHDYPGEPKSTTVSVSNFHRPRYFPFSHLIDVNRFDKNKSSKKPKCADSSDIWDPYRKKCIKLSCALPGYVIKDNKCVSP